MQSGVDEAQDVSQQAYELMTPQQQAEYLQQWEAWQAYYQQQVTREKHREMAAGRARQEKHACGTLVA